MIFFLVFGITFLITGLFIGVVTERGVDRIKGQNTPIPPPPNSAMMDLVEQHYMIHSEPNKFGNETSLEIKEVLSETPKWDDIANKLSNLEDWPDIECSCTNCGCKPKKKVKKKTKTKKKVKKNERK